MNSLISLKYIHSVGPGLKNGYRLTMFGVETQSYRKEHDLCSGWNYTVTKQGFSGTLHIVQDQIVSYNADTTSRRLNKLYRQY